MARLRRHLRRYSWDQICNLYNKGLSIRRTTAELGCSPAHIRRILKKRGLIKHRRYKIRPINIKGDIAINQLTQGYETIIDASDVDLVKNNNWSALVRETGVYANAKVNGRTVPLHRVIMNAPKDSIVDHIDTDGLNNRRSNLRLATRAQNAWNMKNRRNGECKFKGVTRAPRLKTKP